MNLRVYVIKSLFTKHAMRNLWSNGLQGKRALNEYFKLCTHFLCDMKYELSATWFANPYGYVSNFLVICGVHMNILLIVKLKFLMSIM